VTWPTYSSRPAFLAFPVTGQSDEDIALGSDLRAVALMNLGTIEAWSLALEDAERHLQSKATHKRSSSRTSSLARYMITNWHSGPLQI
jgi:hypothetical protein